ncbi:MAG: hypothetical protein OXF56_10840 [Rhodobacteraceae bacterium]|nr:hypothetical protein [Paracoccaceae bacterium]
MANMKIASTATDGLEPLGNPGQRSYDLLKGILLEKLSERHADLLAEPVTSQDGRWTDWYSDGSATKLVDLDESDQDAARAELGRLKSDIEELAGRMSARGDSDNLRLSAALSNILEVPDEASVYVRRVDSPDGCPFQLVLTNWSHRKADQPKAVSVLSTMVPRQPRAAPPAPPVAPPVAVPAVRTAFPWWVFWWLGWLVLGIAIAYLLWLLVLPCGVRLPFGGTLHLCPAAIAEVDRGAAARQDQLEGEIARLELDLATLEGQCQAQPVVPEPSQEVVEAPPPDEIDRRLERENAQQGELSFTLVWNNRSDIDLAVTCPYGSRIYWRNKTENNSSCTGELDVDANVNAGSATSDPVENIFYSRAGSGRYHVEVKLYAKRLNIRAHDFTLRIQDGGATREVQGRVSSEGEIWRYTYER